MMLVVLMTLAQTQAYSGASIACSSDEGIHYSNPKWNSLFDKTYAEYVSHPNVRSPCLSSREHSNATYAGFQLAWVL